MDIPDHQVVAAARTGDPAAFASIWRWLSPSVLGYLRSRGVADAEDCTSEVFLAIFRRMSRFVGDADALRTFAFSVAHARYVDDRRQRERRGRLLEYLPGEDRREARSAESVAVDAISDQRVRNLIGSLAPAQRDVLMLRIVADLSLEQTASVLGKRVGAVKSLQHRGLATLRPILDLAVSR